MSAESCVSPPGWSRAAGHTCLWGVITTVISGSSAALLLPVTEEPHWGGFVRLLPAFAGLQEMLSQRHAATYHIYGFLKSEAAGPFNEVSFPPTSPTHFSQKKTKNKKQRQKLKVNNVLELKENTVEPRSEAEPEPRFLELEPARLLLPVPPVPGGQ